MTSFKYIVAIAVAVFGGCFYIALAAETTLTKEAQENNYQLTTLLSATTSTAQSTQLSGGGGYVLMPGANKITFYFERTGRNGNAGSSAFDVDFSPDGTNWYDYTKLLNATSTTPTSYTSVTLVGTSTSVVSIDIVSNNFYAMRCNVTETTDGEHTCKASVEY